MQKLIFFDTETTGNEQKDFLIQIAYKNGEEKFTGLYKPETKIPPEASAVHHITNKMVEDKPVFMHSNDHAKIKKLFEDKDTVVIAHNAPFDLMIIKKEGIEPKNFICTLRVARYLDKEGKIEKYNLQYLRYLLDIEVEGTAHDALGDVMVLEQLFERLKKKMVTEISTTNGNTELTEKEAIQKMIEISSRPSLLRTFNFGKHTGKKIEDVVNIDRGYLEWLLAEKEKSDQIDEDWIYTLRHHLGI
jgi:DNA polymerase III epsilon subunit-like protein